MTKVTRRNAKRIVSLIVTILVILATNIAITFANDGFSRTTNPNNPLYGSPRPKTTNPNNPLYGSPRPKTTNPNNPLYGSPRPKTTNPNNPLYGSPRP